MSTSGTKRHRTVRAPAARWGMTLAVVLALAGAASCAAERARERRAPVGHETGPNRDAGSPSAPYRDPASLAVGQILHGQTGRLLAETELLDHLARARVVYVGETHDSVEDHQVELALLRGLAARARGALVLGVEMLRRSSQAEADAFIRGEMDEAAFGKVWAEDWGSVAPYAELLRFARERGIRLVALNAEADLVEAVRQQGADGLAPELAGRLPELDLHDPYHRAYLQSIFAGHGHGSASFERFYQVQVLWEEAMAETAARLLDREGEETQVVVLAGSGHVRFGFGIPRRLFRRVPAPYATLLPVHVEVADAKRGRVMDVSPAPPPLAAADFYWAVRYR